MYLVRPRAINALSSGLTGFMLVLQPEVISGFWKVENVDYEEEGRDYKAVTVDLFISGVFELV